MPDLKYTSYGARLSELPLSESKNETTGNNLAEVFPYRLLVVDDEQDVLEALADILIIQGHDVTAVSSGSEALSALQAERFDGLLSDMRMPGMDGPQLYDAVKERFPEMARRTAFVTGDDLSKTARSFLNSCNRPSLGKPFSPDQVAQLIEEMGLS